VSAPARAGRRPATQSAARPARMAGTVRLPVVGIRLQRREALVGAALAVAIVVLALVALGTGDFPLTVPEVIRAMALPDGSFASTIVLEWRLPRVLAALAFGAALGVAGAVFQSLTRNPLGSPDVIGFSTGSYTGALVVTTLAGATFLPTAVGALAGGLGTALVVYLLAYRGGVQGFRLIITGIAVTAVLHGVNTFLLLKAGTEVAMAASIWGAGSLALVGWDRALPAFVALLVLAPAILLLSAPLRQLELGDDAARAHGVRAEPTRLALLVLGVALTAVVTAAAGPIAFVALAAPQIARRLTRSAGLPLVPAGLTGGLLLLAADFAAQHALPGTVPVGIVTVVVGGLYLIALLVREAGRRA
jgi:iron complex transport system permease protein